MTTPEAVHAALDARVDAIGFVFAESKRRVTPERAAELARPARGRVRCIAVTKHPTQGEVDAILETFRPDVFQTDWQDLETLRFPRELTLLPVLRTGGGEPVPLPARVLFEGPTSGTGIPTDWQAAHVMARRTELILAGGLSPANVTAAIAEVRPFGVDVSSGVESSPGLKSPEKIASFVSAARAAAAAVASVAPRSESAPFAREGEPVVTARAPQVDTRHLLADELAGKFPDSRGRFGPFGGRYVPETLIPAFERIEAGMRQHLHSADFQAALAQELKTFVGRPTALTFVPRISERWGAKIYLKREDLAHTGAHKINSAIGQALLAKRIGTQRVIAETGAGQHGVAAAAACARVGLPCTVYMGEVDMERQAPNVGRMRLLGAKVVPVTSGDRTLRAAIDEAMRDWVSDPLGTYYLFGTAAGPHPFPYLVRELQSIIGREARAQMLEQAGGLPDVLIACIGGGSNAIGIFYPFLGDASVRIIGIEAGGKGAGLGDNAATLVYGRPGVLHGCYSLLLQDENGQIQETHSVSAGLDYPGVGPEHALLLTAGRITAESATDDEALACVKELCESEGILPALESSHALVGAKRYAKANPGARILVGLSGRGDKDMPTLQKTLLASGQP